ncbi:hypothetical protein ACX1DX_00895 [Tessaracoccus sp. Y36]
MQIFDKPLQHGDGVGVTEIARVRVALRLAMLALSTESINHPFKFVDLVHAYIVP